MVYKGRLKDGRIVAIKRGKKDAHEQRLSVEFRTEVEMLSQVRFSFSTTSRKVTYQPICVEKLKSLSSCLILPLQ